MFQSQHNIISHIIMYNMPHEDDTIVWKCGACTFLCKYALCYAQLRLEHTILFTCYKFRNFKFFLTHFVPSLDGMWTHAKIPHDFCKIFMYDIKWYGHATFRNELLIRFATSDRHCFLLLTSRQSNVITEKKYQICWT